MWYILRYWWVFRVNCKCRKKLFDKLIEECTKNIDKIETASENEHKINVVLAHGTLYCFQYSLQSVSELLYILLTFIGT